MAERSLIVEFRAKGISKELKDRFGLGPRFAVPVSRAKEFIREFSQNPKSKDKRKRVL